VIKQFLRYYHPYCIVNYNALTLYSNMKNCLAALWLTLCIVWNTEAQNLNMQLRSQLQFPGQTLANVCGWTSPDGREYALVGASKGLIIVEVTNPAQPVQIVQLPGPDNLWKEIKTYSHYAYVTSEGGEGVQIVDLSGLPSANLTWHYYTGTGAINGQLDAIHALHIDVTKGFLYTYGGDQSHGVVHNLQPDPYNPVYVGEYAQNGYIHDGYADNDTLYAGHIYAGILSVVDMTDKSNPQVLGTVETPGKFTHNAWILDDRKHILTTDETVPSFLTSYDVSDPSNIIELDRFSIDDGTNSIGHNTHVLNDWAITSWYTGGVVITDCHRPDNLVRVGQYDTWAGTGPDFDGCWGAFPYFPSGTIIASNIEPAELFILSPTYQRASYVEGTILNGCDNTPLEGAQIEIISGDPGAITKTNPNGVFKTGQAAAGIYPVRVSKPGFTTQIITATLTPGAVVPINITLQPISVVTATGTVVDITGQPVANVPVVLSNASDTYTAQSNASGEFMISCVNGGTYSVTAGLWGYYTSNPISVQLENSASIVIPLTRGYYDDFRLDYGWTNESTAASGAWERGEPVGTTYQNQFSNPETDLSSDLGDECYVTGNGGGQAGSDDVDGGIVTLVSPVMQLADFQGARLSFSYWFFNNGGNNTPDDKFEVFVTNGTQTASVFNTTTSSSNWRSEQFIDIQDFITLNNQVRVRFVTGDTGNNHLVEGGVDAFRVEPFTSSAPSVAPQVVAQILPNPSSTTFHLQATLPAGTRSARLEVRDVLGRYVEMSDLASDTQVALQFGQNYTPGVYMATLVVDGVPATTTRLVKQ
jgi:choice-of-anchor B domain-containing protein